MKLLHMYKILEEKNTNVEIMLLLFSHVLRNWNYISKHFISEYKGHFVKTTNCALILWVNNKHTKTKRKLDYNSKNKIYKQYSYQQLSSSCVPLIVHLRLCSALEIMTETTST